jgi:hypothetical protein
MTMADSEVKRANANNIPVTFKQLTWIDNPNTKVYTDKKGKSWTKSELVDAYNKDIKSWKITNQQAFDTVKKLWLDKYVKINTPTTKTTPTKTNIKITQKSSDDEILNYLNSNNK